MTAHTPGRLVEGKFGVLRGGPELEYVNGSAQSQIAMVTGSADGEQQANTRRLAACWNSFVGINTEDVEAMGGVARFKGEPVGELATVRAELEAANMRIAELEAGCRVALDAGDVMQEEFAGARALLADVVAVDAAEQKFRLAGPSNEVEARIARIRTFLKATA